MKNIPAILAALAVTVICVQADTIVDFNSTNYVTAGVTLNGWSSSGATFDDSSTPRSPLASYSGPTFYGGGTVAASAGSGSFSTFVVANNQASAGGDDPIRLVTTWSGTSAANDVKFYGLFLFNQGDWLTDNSGNVALDSVNALTVSGNRGAANSAGGSGVRFVIEQSGSYFITSLNTVGTTYSAVSLSNPASGSWFNYDPATSLSSIGASASLSLFDNITSVGFLVELGSTGTGANGSTLWSDFQVNVTPVPEPSAGAFMLGGLALLVLSWHKRD